MKGSEWAEWASQDIDVEGITGEIINDAVYERNAYVEEKYNVTVTGVEGGMNMAQVIKTSISAGDYEYDVVTPNMYDTSSLATQGLLLDLNTIPYVDLKQPWWDQRANSDLSINNKLYMTVSDLLIMPNDATWLVIFNKKLLEDFKLENPYSLVEQDKWYFDTMVEMSQGVARDLNGDSVMDEKDIYGHISQFENASGFVLGFGEKVVSKDENDLPYLSINNDRAVGAIEKVMAFMLDRNYSINFQEVPGSYLETQKMFEENRGLFKTTAIQVVIRMRNMETDFGVVPMPKLDENQKEYYNFVHPTTSCIAIPITNNELERTGIILEDLTAKSRYTLRPAYYDVSLNYKYLRDEESVKMLDLVLDGRMYDISQIYNWGGMGNIFFDMMQSHSSDFSSLYAKREKLTIRQMEETVEAYLEIDE